MEQNPVHTPTESLIRLNIKPDANGETFRLRFEIPVRRRGFPESAEA